MRVQIALLPKVFSFELLQRFKTTAKFIKLTILYHGVSFHLKFSFIQFILIYSADGAIQHAELLLLHLFRFRIQMAFRRTTMLI